VAHCEGEIVKEETGKRMQEEKRERGQREGRGRKRNKSTICDIGNE